MPTTTKKPSFLGEAREGFGFVRERPWLWASLIASAFMNVAIAARTVLLPYIVKNDLHTTALGLGIVAAATGAGALICALVVGQRGLPHRHVLAMYIGWTLFLVAITAYGIGTSITELACFAFAGGIGLALGNAIWGTMMHRLVPRELLGRVSSIDLFFAFSLMPLYTILIGLIAATAGARTTLIAAGTTGTLVAISFLIATPGLRDSETDGTMTTPTTTPVTEPQPFST
jgi:DHA3 family tetracycline resistance protein-like MFS transporter